MNLPLQSPMSSRTLSSDQPIRVAVIGVGNMGRNHLRVYAGLKNARLVGVYDPDAQAAASIVPQYNATVFSSLEALCDQVDAVSICSPSSTHAEVGLFCLQRGIHCLIEKPLATTESECLALIAAAEKAKITLLVGHIERFNPAVQQIASFLQTDVQIHAIDTRRLSSVSKRITDVDVVLDLMVHDIDIVLALMQREVTSVSAAGVKTYNSPGGDYVTTLLGFAGGAVATLTASRISQNTVRKLSVTTDRGLIEVDYINQSIEIYQQDEVVPRTARAAAFFDYTRAIAMERVLVRRSEPLQMELAHFLDAVRNQVRPAVTGTQALEALRLAWKIHQCLRAD